MPGDALDHAIFTRERSSKRCAGYWAPGLLWVSDDGKLGLTPDRKVPPTAAEEARLVLDDVKATLAAAGMSMDDLVSVQIFCSDVAHFEAFNRVYRTYFTKEFPARAFLGAGTLLFGARFEVQAVAVRR